MKLLVTGASGLLGANLSYIASQNGIEVLAAYNEHHIQIKGCEMWRLNLLEPDFTRARDFKPDAIVHCAAYTNVDGCETEPQKAREINVDATVQVTELSEELDSRLIFISTDSIFDGSRPFHREDEIPNPPNVYSKTKVEAEKIVAGIKNSVVIRTNIYGFNVQKKYSFSEWLHAKFLAGEEIPAFTDFFFSPILVNNLADAIIELAGISYCGTLHVAGNGRVSKYEFTVKFADRFGLSASLVKPTKMADVKLKAPRPHDCSLDISKARGMLKTKILNIDEGISYYKRLYDSNYVNRMTER